MKIIAFSLHCVRKLTLRFNGAISINGGSRKDATNCGRSL
uniref:Uncharacterized protein n=1 Tax=Tetranychus urticae TaxID=32264 RepID=T1K040_TETUR